MKNNTAISIIIAGMSVATIYGIKRSYSLLPLVFLSLVSVYGIAMASMNEENKEETEDAQN